MNITSIKYANKEQTQLLVNGNLFVPWPCNTWHNEEIQLWLGNVWVVEGSPPEGSWQLGGSPVNTIDPFKTLNELKDDKKQEINSWREGSFAVATVDYDGNTYDANRTSQANINGTLTTIQSQGSPLVVPEPLSWRTSDNQDVDLSYTELSTVAALMFQVVNQAYTHSWNLKAAVDAATTKEDIDAVVWGGSPYP